MLRVATLNIWGWFGNWPERFSTLKNSLPSINPDILFLQELRESPESSQLEEIQQAFNYPYSLTAITPEPEHREGIGILSKLPLKSSASLPLPTSTPSRLKLKTEVNYQERTLHLATAHTGFWPRETCYRQVEDFLGFTDNPLILGGDMNADPEIVIPLAQKLGLKGNQTDPTWPTDLNQLTSAYQIDHGYPYPEHYTRTASQIDYLFHRGVELARGGVEPLGKKPPYASDHALVWGDYQFARD